MKHIKLYEEFSEPSFDDGHPGFTTDEEFIKFIRDEGWVYGPDACNVEFRDGELNIEGVEYWDEDDSFGGEDTCEYWGVEPGKGVIEYLPVVFGEVYGGFYFTNKGLKSLKGLPHMIQCSCNLDGNKFLTLDGLDKEVPPTEDPDMTDLNDGYVLTIEGYEECLEYMERLENNLIVDPNCRFEDNPGYEESDPDIIARKFYDKLVSKHVDIEDYDWVLNGLKAIKPEIYNIVMSIDSDDETISRQLKSTKNKDIMDL